MKLAWAIAAFVLTAVVVIALALSPEIPPGQSSEAGYGYSLGSLTKAMGMPALLAIGVPALLGIAAAPGGLKKARGLAVAAKAAWGLSAVAMLAALSQAFWNVGEFVEDPRDLAVGLSWIYVTPIWGGLAGGLLYDSLRLRADRREGRVPVAPVGDGLMIAMVGLASVTVFLTWATF